MNWIALDFNGGVIRFVPHTDNTLLHTYYTHKSYWDRYNDSWWNVTKI